jgi:GDP-L-fucose synthase
MEIMEKIVVTGGSGLVGYAIQEICKNYNYEFIFLSSKDFNLLDMEETKKMFETHRPNYVIHLAACVGGLYKNMNNKVEMLEKNLMMNYNIIKLSHEYKVKKLIACLSTCIFPDLVESYPIKEEMLHEGPPHESNYTYAYAKRMIEIHCRAYKEQYGDNFVCITPTNIYGPHDNFDLDNGHVLPSLIHKCYLAKKNNEKFVIRGSGKPLRQFIYSQDLGKLIMLILENQNQNQDNNIILSVSENQENSIEEVGRIIAKKYDYEHMIDFDTSYSDGQYKKTVSNDKLKQIIGDFEFTNITNGINQTVEWFINRQSTCISQLES